jgi:hypothetical protein
MFDYGFRLETFIQFYVDKFILHQIGTWYPTSFKIIFYLLKKKNYCPLFLEVLIKKSYSNQVCG